MAIPSYSRQWREHPLRDWSTPSNRQQLYDQMILERRFILVSEKGVFEEARNGHNGQINGTGLVANKSDKLRQR